MRPSPRGLAALALVPLLGPPSLALLLAACGADRPLAPTASALAEAGTDAAQAEGLGGGSEKRGAITIALAMRPKGPTDVSFTTTGKKLPDFALDDDADPTLPNSRTFTRLKAGTYTVELAPGSDVTLTQIDCASSGTDNNTVDVAGGSVTINLEPGESVACAFVDGWAAGDVLTYSQITWGETPTATNAAGLLAANFTALYRLGVEMGIPGTAGYSMLFADVASLLFYLPASGPPAALRGDHVNPGSTEAGVFGGLVTGLTLNVDFSDAGLLAGSSGVAFGDLVLCNMSSLSVPLLDGLTVRQYLGIVNTRLGGGSGTYDIDPTHTSITAAFDVSFQGGVPSQFAQEHLFDGACP